MPLPGDILIRISADGRVSCDGVPEDLLEVLAAVCPRDPALACRMEALRRVREARGQAQSVEEGSQNGCSPPGE
jgi:hypothetical protein